MNKNKLPHVDGSGQRVNRAKKGKSTKGKLKVNSASVDENKRINGLDVEETTSMTDP